ncbi:MAG: hypothetical protein IJL89_04120 [Firmicutes bacterium]|nr:hypothetical protein [Bacillota bacterium]
MKKLLKHISPLAPDDSGACSVLYELGGIVVICDAGGCAGNVCGFDEPRWFIKKSALFSAGLRDMDAILGRDDKLVEKLARVTEQINGRFTAIVGTPVPAVIATDYRALKRMSEKKTGLPCITVEATGTNLYDKGEEEAYLALFKEFAREKLPAKAGKVGVIGATPLNTGLVKADVIINRLKEKYDEVVCFGMDSGLDEIINASECEKIIVISNSGISAAEYLKEKFGTEYEFDFPCIPEETLEKALDISDKRVLIIHQQVAANALRELLNNCKTDCAGWFGVDKNIAKENDFHIKDEDDLIEKAENYDVIIGDISFEKMLPKYKGEFIDFPHFAVSGRVW